MVPSPDCPSGAARQPSFPSVPPAPGVAPTAATRDPAAPRCPLRPRGPRWMSMTWTASQAEASDARAREPRLRPCHLGRMGPPTPSRAPRETNAGNCRTRTNPPASFGAAALLPPRRISQARTPVLTGLAAKAVALGRRLKCRAPVRKAVTEHPEGSAPGASAPWLSRTPGPSTPCLIGRNPIRDPDVLQTSPAFIWKRPHPAGKSGVSVGQVLGGLVQAFRERSGDERHHRR